MASVAFIRILAIFLLGVGIIFQVVLSQNQNIKESIGKINADKNQQIAKNRKDLLLPDLRIDPPSQLYITDSGGEKKIRFNTTFFNVGAGPLELVGELSEASAKTIATQVINKIDGSDEKMVVGEFVFHPGHDHWHVDKYAQFQLWRYNTAGEPTQLFASTDKFSFCIWDEHTYDLSLEGAPNARVYLRCPENLQGNSVGWGDTYTADLEGQELDVSGIEDGKYLVTSAVNAENKIIESDYSNNIARAYVEIRGNNITLLPGP